MVSRVAAMAAKAADALGDAQHVVATDDERIATHCRDLGIPAVMTDPEETPFSGTTLVHDETGRALWFSKNLIPAMRKEAALRAAGGLSPVCRHIGLYAYRLDALRRYVSLPEGRYEQLEGLEQLRLLENGMSIQCVEVEPDTIAIPGIDTAEDVALAERLVAEHGDPLED